MHLHLHRYMHIHVCHACLDGKKEQRNNLSDKSYTFLQMLEVESM